MPTPRRSSFSHAFTLIELLVVIAIIVLALSLAVPTLNVLEGNRSLETAQNDISAYLGIARTDAMYYRQPMGVCFYIDPVTQQTAMIEVAQVPSTIFSDTTWTTANTNAIPLDVAGTFNTAISPPLLNSYRDVQLLPKGISVALYFSPGTTAGVDHLVRMGVIMFDQYGTLSQTQFGIPVKDQTATSLPNALATALNLSADLNPTASPFLYSSPGLIIYDHQLYTAQGAEGFSNPDADFIYQPLGQAAPTSVQKTAEEAWIAGNYTTNPVTAGNGISLMVNQFNGTLVKGQ